MARKEKDLEKAYALLMNRQEANIARNLAEGRTLGTREGRNAAAASNPLTDADRQILEEVSKEADLKRGNFTSPVQQRSETLGDVLSDIKENSGLVQNESNIVKTTPSDVIGIDPKVAYKSRFPSTKSVLSQSSEIPVLKTVAEAAAEIPNESAYQRIMREAKNKANGEVATEEGFAGNLKKAGGFSKTLHALGLGAAALGGLGIANKVMAGDTLGSMKDAGMLGASFHPVTGPAIAAHDIGSLGGELAGSKLRESVSPDSVFKKDLESLNTGELGPEDMQAREIYNAARKSKLGEAVNTPSNEQLLLAPEDRVKKEDLDSLLKNIALNRRK